MKGILGIFKDREDLAIALKEMPIRNYTYLETFSPYPDDELCNISEPTRSPIRWMTLLGGIMGGICGLSLTIWTTLQWPLLITGGKPLISFPPFLIIAFELTILLGALATAAGFLYWGIARRFLKSLPYDVRFSQGHFGLWIECPQSEIEKVVNWIEKSGVTEWKKY